MTSQGSEQSDRLILVKSPLGESVTSLVLNLKFHSRLVANADFAMVSTITSSSIAALASLDLVFKCCIVYIDF